MADKSALTVVVLTYNSAATIGVCLDALMQQYYQDFDVVVVDDDSTDETVSIVSTYSSRLRLSIRRNGSHNIPRGRNIGISCAQTDLVAFVDSDDYPAPEWTRVIVETFRMHPDHLWGHSWEIEAQGDWSRLRSLLRFITEQHVTFATNTELARQHVQRDEGWTSNDG